MSWMETCRGVVYPWHCDQLGHMNVQHYVGHFDIAAFHFLAELGFKADGQQDSGITLVAAQHTMDVPALSGAAAAGFCGRVGGLLRLLHAVSAVRAAVRGDGDAVERRRPGVVHGLVRGALLSLGRGVVTISGCSTASPIKRDDIR